MNKVSIRSERTNVLVWEGSEMCRCIGEEYFSSWRDWRYGARKHQCLLAKASKAAHLICKAGWYTPQAEVKHRSKTFGQWLSDYRQLFAVFFTNESQVPWLPWKKQANLGEAQGKAEEQWKKRNYPNSNRF